MSKTGEILQMKLGQDFEIDAQQPNNPKLKIIDISNGFSDSELESDINSDNFYHSSNKCKVL